MWVCSSHTEGKFHGSCPDLRSDLPIYPPSFLSAGCVADLRGVLGKSGCCEAECTPIIIREADKTCLIWSLRCTAIQRISPKVLKSNIMEALCA